MQRWAERPEARWAFWCGAAGALVALAASTVSILSHGAPAACSRADEPRILFWVALAAATAPPLVLAWELWQGLG